MAYVAEGLGNLLDWDQAMEYQRKNGSLFNSPATTAAAAIHNYNGRALDYLDSLISRFGSSGVECRTCTILPSKKSKDGKIKDSTGRARFLTCANGHLQCRLCIRGTRTPGFAWWTRWKRWGSLWDFPVK
jgi:hypothetical protein